MKIIVVEEHFQIPSIREKFVGLDNFLLPKWEERLFDLGALRIREMDEAGIDVQFLSHITPGTLNLEPSLAVKLAIEANDQLYKLMTSHPGRFEGYAELALPDPKAAADELERVVTRYGFKGGMINGLNDGCFLDEERFRPILERANELKVPLYLHPSTPHQAVVDAYYKDYPAMARAGWGFGLEAATHATRLIMSGLLDRYPNLRFVLGHLGESIPFWLWRANKALTRDGNLNRPFRESFQQHFYVSTSGHFSNAALVCSLLELGADRILFAVDWPMQSNTEGVDFLMRAPIGDDDREKIMSRNAAALFNLSL